MSGARDTLIGCFAAVLPHVASERVPVASHENTEDWDSVAMVTLIAVVEETFDVRVAAQDLESFGSFAGILDYLRRQGKT